MAKILVTVFCPAINEEYDVLIPDDIIIETVTKLIGMCLEDLSDNYYISSGHELLCIEERKLLLNYNHTLYDYGIQNGDRLLLF